MRFQIFANLYNLWQNRRQQHSQISFCIQHVICSLSKGKARAELRPARRQARLPHSRSLLLPGRERQKLGSAGRGSPRPEQPLGRGSALPRLGAELELRLSGSSLGASNEYSVLMSFRIDYFDLLAVQGTLKHLLQHHSLKAPILRHSAFFMIQLSQLYMTTAKTIALSIQTFVGKVMSLLFNTLLDLSQFFFQGASVF